MAVDSLKLFYCAVSEIVARSFVPQIGKTPGRNPFQANQNIFELNSLEPQFLVNSR